VFILWPGLKVQMYALKSLKPRKLMEGKFKTMNLTDKYLVLLDEDTLTLHDVSNLHIMCTY